MRKVLTGLVRCGVTLNKLSRWSSVCWVMWTRLSILILFVTTLWQFRVGCPIKNCRYKICFLLSHWKRNTFLGHPVELIKIHYPGTPVCSITLARSTSALQTSYCHFLVPIRPHSTLPVFTPIRMFRPYLQSRIFLVDKTSSFSCHLTI